MHPGINDHRLSRTSTDFHYYPWHTTCSMWEPFLPSSEPLQCLLYGLRSRRFNLSWVIILGYIFRATSGLMYPWVSGRSWPILYVFSYWCPNFPQTNRHQNSTVFRVFRDFGLPQNTISGSLLNVVLVLEGIFHLLFWQMFKPRELAGKTSCRLSTGTFKHYFGFQFWMFFFWSSKTEISVPSFSINFLPTTVLNVQNDCSIHTWGQITRQRVCQLVLLSKVGLFSYKPRKRHLCIKYAQVLRNDNSLKK